MADSKDYVVFEDSAGNEVSNDPRWKAEKLLGIQKEQGVDALQAELEELREFKRAHDVAQAPNQLTGEGPDEEEPDDTDAPDAENPYASVTGKDLTSLARDRGITIVKGMKAGDVRNALAAQDLGKASA